MIKQIHTYYMNPEFAWQQALELMQQQEAFKIIISNYLIHIGSEDRQLKTKASYSEDQVFDLIFGEQIKYFKATFGNKFNLTE